MAVSDYVSGPDTIDYTPGSDVAAGAVVILSTTGVGITKVAIPANTQGTLHVQGVFDIDCASGTTFSQQALLYWNAGTAKITTTNTDVLIGRAAAAKTSGQLKARVRINCA
jgi:predicted RecA/RadA family phage recombinase